MSRKRTAQFRCGHDGCHEFGAYSYSNRKERRTLEERHGQGRWRCTRHTKPEQVLGLDSTTRALQLVATRSPRADGLYGHDGERLCSGFAYGPGFKAWADDFPEGTVLTITAQVEVPSEVRPC